MKRKCELMNQHSSSIPQKVVGVMRQGSKLVQQTISPEVIVSVDHPEVKIKEIRWYRGDILGQMIC